MRSLVTGASGYLGRSLVPALRRADQEVYASYFRGASPQDCLGAVCGDLQDPRTWVELAGLMPGVQTVFHLAGIAHQQADADRYRRVNLEASVALAEAARDAGVRRFIYLSSVKAADGASSLEPGTVVPVVDYATSKSAAEAALRSVCGAGAMELVIVRPALVYGGDVAGHLALLRRWVRWRLPRPPAGGRLSMIGRDDLIALLIAIAAHEGERLDLITATDGECYSTRRLFEAYSQALHRRPLLPSPPAAVWRMVSDLRDIIGGEVRGSTWERLAGDMLAEAEGMDSLSFSPTLNFERSLGL